MKLSVREARSEDYPAVAAVLARAFRRDAVTVGVVGDPAEPGPYLEALFGAMIRRVYTGPGGTVDVAELDGEIVGAAIWGRPGRGSLTVLQVVLLFVDLAPLFRWRLVRLIRHSRLMGVLTPTAPHWYLFAIGAGVPGAGVGGALLDHAFARVGDDPCYLEASTADSARLYARKGFQEVGRLPSPGDVERQYAMWRPQGR